MTDIQEIPLDIAEEVQDIAENTEEIMPEEPVILEEVKPVIKPKAKGRPKGAVNKGPSKPRAKKTQIQEAPVEEESQVYEPSSPKRNLKLPTDPSSRCCSGHVEASAGPELQSAIPKTAVVQLMVSVKYL